MYVTLLPLSRRIVESLKNTNAGCRWHFKRPRSRKTRSAEQGEIRKFYPKDDMTTNAVAQALSSQTQINARGHQSCAEKTLCREETASNNKLSSAGPDASRQIYPLYQYTRNLASVFYHQQWIKGRGRIRARTGEGGKGAQNMSKA